MLPTATSLSPFDVVVVYDSSYYSKASLDHTSHAPGHMDHTGLWAKLLKRGIFDWCITQRAKGPRGKTGAPVEGAEE